MFRAFGIVTTDHRRPEADIELGSSGDEVDAIQRALSAMGFYGGPVDGVFGEETQAGVMAFQRLLQIRPTGVVNARVARSITLMARHWDLLTEEGPEAHCAAAMSR